MKKFLFTAVFALIVGLCSFSSSTLAGPPDGWGAPPKDESGTTDPLPIPVPVEEEDASGDGKITPLGGPPDGWG